MRNNITIQDLLGQTDIYLIDQIMKGRYSSHDAILDAGCGSGRNMHWFLQHGYLIKGIDSDKVAIEDLKAKHPDVEACFRLASVEKTGYTNNTFNHIICSAVLHFAISTAHFKAMFSELVRILKPGGSFFIRMASNIGIEDKVQFISEGKYAIPDGSNRFLLTRQLLAECMQQNNLSFIEPLKTVNVDDERCMSTLLLQKNAVIYNHNDL